MSNQKSFSLPEWVAYFRHPLFVVSVSAVIVTALFVCGILSSYALDKIRAEKREQVVELRDAARALVASANQSILKSLISVYEHELTTPDSTAALEASEFKAIGSFSQDELARWVDDTFVSRSPQIERGWFAKLERQIQFANVRPGELTWARVTSDSGQVVFAVLSFVQVKTGENLKNKIVVALSSQALLAPYNLISKGNSTQMFVVDRDGYTYSYPEAQYVGAKIDSHPVVRAMIDEATTAGVANYVGLDGSPIVAANDWVSESNLGVVVTAPRVSVRQLTAQFFAHTALVVIGLTILLGLGMAWLLSRDVRERDLLLKNLALLQKPKTDMIESGVSLKTSQVETSLHAPVNYALKEVVRAVVDYLRMPLTAMLGNLQIADHQDSVKAMKESITPAIGEARRLRDFIETLCKETDLTEVKREVVDVLPILNHVLSAYRGLVSKYDISLEENFKADFAVRGDIDRVRSSVSTMLLFAIEYVGQAESKTKRLVVNLEKLAGLGQISIEGYGRELKADLKRQLFVPFKTKLKMGTQFGLDMVLAQARVEEMQGETFIENIGVDGFRVIVRFATALKVTADQMTTAVNPASKAYATQPETVDDMLTSKKVSQDSHQKLPPEPPAAKFELAQIPIIEEVRIETTESANSEFQIRKPKLRLDL